MADFLLVIVVLFGVVLIVSAPLRRARQPEPSGSSELAELEAARDAKYRELRDADLDHRTGKLSDADYQALDQGLRAEAIEILRSIDHERAGEGAAGAAEPTRASAQPTRASAQPTRAGAEPTRGSAE